MIVVYSIPVWLAEAIDSSIDGAVSYSGAATTGAAATDISAANTGRVRRWDGNITTATNLFTPSIMANGYAKGTETRDTLVAISFQFDVNKLPN